MCAAAGAGWFDGVPAAAEAMSAGITRVTQPSASRVLRYAELLEIYREIYPRLRQTSRKLKAFGARC
jgi:ribulose kinase